MRIEYNSPEMKIARVVIVVVLAALAIGWLVSQYSWARDVMQAPGLSALKFLFVLTVFVGFGLLMRTAWQAILGKGNVGGAEHVFSYKAMVAEGLIIIAGLALYWAANAGWFGASWAIYPV